MSGLAGVLKAHEDPPGWTCPEDDSEVLVFECECGDRSPVLTGGLISKADCEVVVTAHPVTRFRLPSAR